MPRAAELLQAAKALPRYAANDDIRFVEQAIRFRSLTSPSQDQTNDALNFFAVYLRSADSRKRIWATLLSAVAARQTERKMELYSLVADSTLATSWQRWYAHQDMGEIYLVVKKDRQKAKYHYERALQNEKSRGVLENLAYIEELEGNWPKAYQRFEEASQFVEAYKKRRNLATLGIQEAVLYANWCNT